MAGVNTVRAGRAFVELFANDSKLIASLNSARQRVQAFAGQIASVGLRAGAAGGAIMAPLGTAFGSAVTRGRDVLRLADTFKITTESVSTMAYAFDTAGVSFEEFSSVLDGVAGHVRAAADANERLINVAGAMNGRQLIGMGLDKQLEAIADDFARITKPIDQATEAQRLFGAAGTRLIPVLAQGAEGIRKLKAEGAARGFAMGREEAQQSAEVMKAWNVTLMEVGVTIRQIGAALLPTTDQTKSLSDVVRGMFQATREWVAENKNLIILAAEVAGGMILAGIALKAFGTALGVASIAIKGVIIGLKGIGLALTMLTGGPIGAATLAIGGLGAAWLTLTEKGQAAAGELRQAFISMVGTAKETVGGIAAAVKSGNMELAFKIAATGIKAIWFEMISALARAFGQFVEDNRTKLIALASLYGGIKGGKLGSYFGPLGTVIGVAAGAGGAGVGAGEIADKLADIGKNPGLDAKVAGLKDELRKLVTEAKAKGPDGKEMKLNAEEIDKLRMEKEMLKKQAEAIPALGSSQKGVFAGPIAQQLGYGDQTAKRQLDAIEKGNGFLAKLVELAKEQAKNKGGMVFQPGRK